MRMKPPFLLFSPTHPPTPTQLKTQLRPLPPPSFLLPPHHPPPLPHPSCQAPRLSRSPPLHRRRRRRKGNNPPTHPPIPNPQHLIPTASFSCTQSNSPTHPPTHSRPPPKAYRKRSLLPPRRLLLLTNPPPTHPPIESSTSFKPPRSPLPPHHTHPPTHPPTHYRLPPPRAYRKKSPSS